MKVLIIKAFVDRVNSQVFRPAEGDVIEMPKGAGWLDAGFAVPAIDGPEAATMDTPETAAKPAAQKRRKKEAK